MKKIIGIICQDLAVNEPQTINEAVESNGTG
jgi:hypothetical protein